MPVSASKPVASVSWPRWSGGALERFGGIDRAALPKGRRWSKTLPIGDHAACSSAAGLVLAERPSHGRGAVRDDYDAPVCSSDAQRSDSRRHNDHEFPAPAGEASVGGGHPGNHQQLLRDNDLSLRQGTIVDATIIHAPSSTKNKEGKRDPEMHQTKKGNQYFFGIKAHIGANAESALVHHLHGAAANVADVTEVTHLLHGDENFICADAGYTGMEKRPEHEG